MSYSATVYKVMIASPSDVATERNIIKEMLSEWTIVNADARKTVLLPISWDTHSVPEMGDRPQSIINKQILRDCDLLVGVFWTRIGTATGNYESGSVEEIEEHIQAGKPVMLYFSSAPVVPDSVDPDQYARLKQFKDSCQSRGLLTSYSELGEFRSKFYRQLQLKLNQKEFAGSNAISGQSIDEPQASPVLQLSREAKILLKGAADSDGQIIYLHVIGGLIVQVGGRNYVEDNNPRSRATWEGALAELENNGLVIAGGTKREIFKMTREGFAVADQIAV